MVYLKEKKTKALRLVKIVYVEEKRERDRPKIW